MSVVTFRLVVVDFVQFYQVVIHFVRLHRKNDIREHFVLF